MSDRYFLTIGQILTISENLTRMGGIYWMPKLREPFNELIRGNSYKNWHLFCFCFRKIKAGFSV
jgi:hypothetical protein